MTVEVYHGCPDGNTRKTMFNPMSQENLALAGIIGDQGGVLPIRLETGGVVRLKCKKDTNQPQLPYELTDGNGRLVLRGSIRKYVEARAVAICQKPNSSPISELFKNAPIVQEYMLLYRF